MSPAPSPPERTTPPDGRSRLETLIGRFEQEWRDGRRPAIDAFLGGLSDGQRDWLLLELVHTELEHRLKAGLPARVEEYLRRYPQIAARPAAVRDLAAAEMRLRLRAEPGLTPDEYRRRFPGQDITPAGFRGAEPARDAAPTPTAADNGKPAETTLSPTDHPTAPAPSGPSSRQIPGYEIVGELGRGGMGVVYKARHLALGRVVALKMILDGRDAGPEGLARFRAEAQALARLQHPNIVQIHEIGAHDGRPYFSLEYVEGSSLDKKLTGAGVPARQAAQIVETLARAVDVAHRAGVVHRDLKPANVLVGPRWTLKVTDFGLAKRLDEDSGRTRTGQVMGTPCYMAPEQAGAARAVGPAADVYALGAILYELLTGRPPFRGATVMETLRQVLTRDPAPPRRLRPATPADLETICLKCLEKQPAARYASAEALADDLRRLLDGKPVLARPVGMLDRAAKWARRNPALASAAALTAVVVLAATAASSFFLSQKSVAETALTTKDQQLQSTAKQATETESKLTEAQRHEREKAAAVALERLKKGVALCQDGGPAEGLPLLADALRIAPPGDDYDHLRDVIRRNLGAWGRPVGPLLYPMKDAAVALSPDGHTALASSLGDWNKSVLLDVATGAVLADDLPAAGRSGAGRFSADGRFVVTGLASYQRWDARTGKAAGPACGGAVRLGGLQDVIAAAISSDCGAALGVGPDGRLCRWDLATGQVVGKPVAPPEGESFLAASPDAPTFLTQNQLDFGRGGLGSGNQQRRFRFRDAATGAAVGEPIVCGTTTVFTAYSPDGTSLLMAGMLGDGSGDLARAFQIGMVVRIYDTATGKPLGPDMALWALVAPRGPFRIGPVRAEQIYAAQYRPDKRAVWLASEEHHGWWDVTTGKPLGSIRRFPDSVVSAALSADGHTIVAGTRRGLRVWKADGDDEFAGTLVRRYDDGGLAAFTPDAAAVAVVERISGDPHPEYQAGVWDVATGEPVGKPTRLPGASYVFALGADALITLPRRNEQNGALPCQLRFLGLRRGDERRFRLPGFESFQMFGYDIACSRDGRRWAAMTSSDVTGRLQVYETPADGPPPSGPAGGDDGPWQDARLVGPPIPLPTLATAIALSPDGKAAAAATTKGAYLWSAADGKPVGGPILSGTSIERVGFSADGKAILVTVMESPPPVMGLPRSHCSVWKVGADPAVALGPPLDYLDAGLVGGGYVGLSGDGRAAVGQDNDGLRLGDVETGVPIGPSLGFPFNLYTPVASMFTPDGRELLAAMRRNPYSLRSVVDAPTRVNDFDSVTYTGLEVRRLHLPSPLEGQPESLKLWSEVVAGAEVDGQGAVHALDAPTLAERRRRLSATGDFRDK